MIDKNIIFIINLFIPLLIVVFMIIQKKLTFLDVTIFYYINFTILVLY